MKNPRPNSTKLAMCCLVASYAIASVRMISRLSWSDVFTYVLGIPTLLIAGLLVIMLVRGENWARWVFVVLTSCWLMMLSFDHKGMTALDAGLPVLHLILNLTAAFLLFTRSSNDWFSHYRKSV